VVGQLIRPAATVARRLEAFEYRKGEGDEEYKSKKKSRDKAFSEETTLIAAACAGGTSATKRATMQTQARLALFAQAREGDNSCLRGRQWSILLSL
jgi:hypothetical protein